MAATRHNHAHSAFDSWANLDGKSWGRTNSSGRTVRLMGAHNSVLRFIWGSHQNLSTYSYPTIVAIGDRHLPHSRPYLTIPPQITSLSPLHRYPHTAASLRSRYGYMNPSSAKNSLLLYPLRQYSGGDNLSLPGRGSKLRASLSLAE